MYDDKPQVEIGSKCIIMSSLYFRIEKTADGTKYKVLQQLKTGFEWQRVNVLIKVNLML